MLIVLIFIRTIIMKYKYVYLAIIMMTILHMYYVHADTYHTYPSKRMVAVINATLPIVPNSTLKDVIYRKAPYSYHKQTLSLFYMKRRNHIR